MSMDSEVERLQTLPAEFNVAGTKVAFHFMSLLSELEDDVRHGHFTWSQTNHEHFLDAVSWIDTRRAAIVSGRRPRAVQREAKAALAWFEASELCYDRPPVVRRCRSSAAEPAKPGRRGVGDRVRQPVVPRCRSSTAGPYEDQFLRTINSKD